MPTAGRIFSLRVVVVVVGQRMKPAVEATAVARILPCLFAPALSTVDPYGTPLPLRSFCVAGLQVETNAVTSQTQRLLSFAHLRADVGNE